MAKKRTTRKKVTTKVARKRARRNAGAPMQIAFSSTKSGKPRAYRVDMRQMRYFPMGYDAAKLAISTGKAVEVSYRPFSKEGPDSHKKNSGGRRRGSRRNPGDVEAAAVEQFRDFHGHDPDVQIDVVTPKFEHSTLSGLGMLKALVIKAVDGKHMVTLEFKNTVLARPPRKTDLPQLYLEGGDQSVNLADFGIAKNERHEQEILGAVHEIVYHTNKTHLVAEDGGKANYKHKFKTTRDGDRHVRIKNGRFPIAFYDVRNRLISLAGGSYEIPAEGING